ncbi:unnamed protein product [Nezara viridula]|uniref:ZBR-type domain-containing protein n=1 Tax=Nezara viridula TaxID=85310 RepID=A0A9P0HM61_NEZVI|nr:unnamed protein product [Nezara viridula]
MAASKSTMEFSSPTDGIFTWATPLSQPRDLDFSTKRKCNNDSGYNSVSPASVSRTLNHHYSGATPDITEDTRFVSREGEVMYTPATKVKTDCKRLLLHCSQDGKSSEYLGSPPIGEMDSYSDFLMDASLYTEPMDISVVESSPQLNIIPEESLDMCEITKKITVDLSMDVSSICSEPITPLRKIYADRLFKTPLTPIKASYTSPRKKRFPLKKKVHRPKFLTGFEKIDILYQLGEKSTYNPAIERILSYLSDNDLSNVTMVSKSWKNICLSNPKAKERWLNYISRRKEIKENLHCSGGKQKISTTPLLNRNHSTPLKLRQPSSPPVSPSKLRFHLFQKEASKLKEDETLMACPSCSLPSTCSPSTRLGRCSRLSCGMEFCCSCRSPYHGRRPCTTSTPISPQKPKRIGSKESKRFLRRL